MKLSVYFSIVYLMKYNPFTDLSSTNAIKKINLFSQSLLHISWSICYTFKSRWHKKNSHPIYIIFKPKYILNTINIQNKRWYLEEIFWNYFIMKLCSYNGLCLCKWNVFIKTTKYQGRHDPKESSQQGKIVLRCPVYVKTMRNLVSHQCILILLGFFQNYYFNWPSSYSSL